MRAYPPTSYDVVPYESNVFPQSHPNRLATIATLLGMRPAPVTKCRVLELGCASGGNLVPMGLGLPESTFLGLDLSKRQIETGQKLIEKVGLKNVELRQLDFRDADRDLGQFDYVICHGVYSWVPPDVQDKILTICSENLTPRGIAYVSYNTYPGWHMRGIIRDVMLYHAKQFADPVHRVRQARNLLDFMSKSVTQKDDPYSLLLKNEVELIRKCQDSYLFHDHLEDENNPVYFHQFAERAAAKGLQYLGEVDFRVMLAANYPPEVQNVLQALSPDAIHLEQYMDFLRNRMFRQTLLCHKAVQLTHQVRAEMVTGLAAASPARPSNEKPDVRSTEPEKFEVASGATVTTSQPIFKAALVHLNRAWPQALPFDALRAAARSAVGGPADPADSRVLAECLLNCYASAGGSLLELHAHAPQFAREPGERPVASPLARAQAAEGARVTNLRHENVLLNAVDRQLLTYLDGTRDRSTLANVVADLVKAGELTVKEQDRPVTDPDRVKQLATPVVAERLSFLGRSALLVQ
ncbi:MAG: methyltransferase regulatory domain-containing protein [Zavarzinella sp.]|nr:methyltransferase regulatory domain-containing protein [Zavarzinella sp.]